MSTLKELAAQVRRVYEPPERRAWGLADVAIVKLLRAIEDAPEATDRNAVLDEVICELESAFLLDEDIAAVDVVRALKR